MKQFIIAALLGTSMTVTLKKHKVEEVMDHFQGYTPGYDGFEGNNHLNGEWRYAYTRQVPENFTGSDKETFTAKMIREFATEGHDKDTGLPTGHFFLTKNKVREAAYEVLATHLGLTEKKQQDDYLNKYFDSVFAHMDVNETGNLEAIETNRFMRTLCKPVKENIYLE